MNPPQKLTDPAARPAGLRRPGLARAAWVVVAALALSLFVATLPAQYAELRLLAEAARPHVARIGLTVEDYTAYQLALNILVALVFCGVGATIFVRKASARMALLVSLMLILIGAWFPIRDLAEQQAGLRFPIACLSYGATVAFLTLFYLFPDGRFVPRWTCALAPIFATLELSYTFFPNASQSAFTLPPLFATLAWVGWLATCVFAQVYRYHRVSDPEQRQQTKWVVFGMTAAIVGSLLLDAPRQIDPSLQQPGALYSIADATLANLLWLFVPISFGVAIFRYRLWDIDILINRTLVYSGLTTSVVGIYVVLVGYLSALFQTSGNLPISLIATGLVAVLFQPLRDRLQRGVNRLLYGERDDPYAVISRLGQRLEATLAPDAVLPAIVQTVAEALRLPYAAIAIASPLSVLDSQSHQGADNTQKAPERTTVNTFEIVAAHGVSPVTQTTNHLVTLPLSYQGETLGQLILSPRTPREMFSRADRRLLDDLARQAGVAAHAVRLTADVQRSRERLVLAREEERRRLRRDLHDGIGPTLAALNLQAGALRTLIPRDPAAADALVVELRVEIRAAIADIRRLVYELRPPALDEIGLVGAIRQHVGQYARGTVAEEHSLQLTVEAPEELPPLPAAVEVAAYRIALEALTNVVRHAHARICVVRLLLDHGLHLEVEDDGIGLPTEGHAGVGLLSMRERAAELSGTCMIERRLGGGTSVRVWLPLP